jgi:hypothetical protein
MKFEVLWSVVSEKHDFRLRKRSDAAPALASAKKNKGVCTAMGLNFTILLKFRYNSKKNSKYTVCLLTLSISPVWRIVWELLYVVPE